MPSRHCLHKHRVTRDLFVEKVKLSEVGRQQQFSGAQEVQNVSEHRTIAVNEIVLLQVVKDDRDAAVEQLGEARVVVSTGGGEDEGVREGEGDGEG